MKTMLTRPCVKRPASQQRGIVLIDAMVAILIFSVGILGMVALQGSAMEMTGSANYRINAAMLADHVIAQMWATDPTQLNTLFEGSGGGDDSSGGASYTAWAKSMDCTVKPHATNCLPGAKANPPSIDVVKQDITASGNTQYKVTVTVYWQAPSDSTKHKYVSVTAIGI
jgi:type IV pilus assembly protein PilV